MLYTSILGAATMISSTMAATLTVQVGAGGQRIYEPNNVKAQIGDIVNFEFVGGNHTVTQSTFANPCTNSGFKSGFRPQGAATTFAIMVNSTEPIWVYCAQLGHCQAGMVMAINAADTGDKTFDAFKALAMGGTAAGGGASNSTGGMPYGGGGQGGTPVSGGTPSGSPSGGQGATMTSGSIPGVSGASGTAPSASTSGGAGSTIPSPLLGILSIMLLQLGLL